MFVPEPTRTASWAKATRPQEGKGTVSQRTHCPRPAAGGDFLIEAALKRFGKTSANVDCSVTVGSGGLVAHAAPEFAF